jgi:heme o synthase
MLDSAYRTDAMMAYSNRRMRIRLHCRLFFVLGSIATHYLVSLRGSAVPLFLLRGMFMAPDPSRGFVSTLRTSLLPALLLLGMYVALIISGTQITLTNLTISWAALTILGAAAAYLVVGRLTLGEAPRLGARAQAIQRRYRILAIGAAFAVYATLILGNLAASTAALTDCLTLPFCLNQSEAALLNNSHRVGAAAATILTIWLALTTWRSRSHPLLRMVVSWGVGLMLSQNAVGMLQLGAALIGAELPLVGIRLAHLAAGGLAWAALAAVAAMALRLPAPLEVSSEHAPDLRGLTDRTLLDTKPSLLKDYISLTKPGVITLLILTTITSMYITPKGAPELMLVFWTSLGGWLMASGSHALNCYFDRDVDINMGRTSRRPIPSGRIPAWHALVLGIVLGIIAFAILVTQVNLLAALLSLAGLLYYVLIYTLWLKRTSWNNIVIGGGAGAFPPLVGWAATTGDLSWAALLLWLIIFYWTPPHFWALAIIRAKDYARAGVPMLPVVAGEQETRRQILLYSIQMLVLTLVPGVVGMFGLPYLLAAVVLGAIFMYYAIRMQKNHATNVTWGLYKYSLLYLALLFVAMVADRVWLA